MELISFYDIALVFNFVSLKCTDSKILWDRRYYDCHELSSFLFSFDDFVFCFVVVVFGGGVRLLGWAGSSNYFQYQTFALRALVYLTLGEEELTLFSHSRTLSQNLKRPVPFKSARHLTNVCVDCFYVV